MRFRVGVNDGMATGELEAPELARPVQEAKLDIDGMAIRDGHSTLDILPAGSRSARPTPYPIARGQLIASVRTLQGESRSVDRLAMFLPLLMWVVAAVLSWLLVRRLLLLPLGRLQRAVAEYQPGDGALVLPQRLGGAEEILSLGGAFERAVDRLEQSELQMGEALHGQRRLVREVHHRVKNNLQVVASLLNIHGRSATTPESRAAYAAIGRRVDALSVVHRNHFAEVEETRGIAGGFVLEHRPDGRVVEPNLQGCRGHDQLRRSINSTVLRTDSSDANVRISGQAMADILTHLPGLAVQKSTVLIRRSTRAQRNE